MVSAFRVFRTGLVSNLIFRLAAQFGTAGSQLMPFVFAFGLIVTIRVQIKYPKIVKFRRTALRALCGRSGGSVDWRDCR